MIFTTLYRIDKDIQLKIFISKIVLNTESDVAQMAKLLAKQVAVVSVNTLMLQEQAAV